jgi:hypothetical protein
VNRITEDIMMMIVTSVAITSVSVITKMLISYITDARENGEYPTGILHIVFLITFTSLGTIIILYILFILL